MSTKFDKLFNNVINECKLTNKVVKESGDDLPVNEGNSNMKISELIALLEEMMKKQGDVEVKVAEVEKGNNASDRYGIGFGLKVGETEIEALQDYIETGCLY